MWFFVGVDHKIVYMKIVLIDDNHAVLEEMLAAAGHYLVRGYDMTVEACKKEMVDAEGLVVRSRFPLDAATLAPLTALKVIGRVGAGMENIDLTYCHSRAIRVVAAPEGNRDAVGEHALGMLLMLLHRLRIADNEVRRGTWLRAENRGTELGMKTVGLIGYGHMGSSFAEKLTGFGCRVMAYDKYKTGFGNEWVEEVSLDVLQRNADIISLHVPLTDETRYMVNAAFLAHCKPAVWLINTARGTCLNTEDVVNAMKAGQVQGVCLDVLEYEKKSFESLDPTTLPEPMQYLIQSDKAILAPHIAGWTHESNYKMSQLVANRLLQAIA